MNTRMWDVKSLLMVMDDDDDDDDGGGIFNLFVKRRLLCVLI